MTKRFIKLLSLDISLILSLTCAFTGVFAWYTANKTTTIGVTGITMEKEMSATLKYFNKNYSSDEGKYVGYKNPGALKSSDTKVETTSYATDFTEYDSLDETPFSFSDIFPDTRMTFAIEVVSNFGSTNNIELKITDFISPLSTEVINRDTNKGICLGEAINIYADVFIYTNDADATTRINNLVTYVSGESGYDDKFTYVNSTDEAPTSFTVSNIDMKPNEKAVFVFDIEYSNLSDTFYSYDSSKGTVDGVRYFYKDSTNAQGGSNVYQSMTFSIDGILIKRNF